jgi:hypothetical protein
MLSSSLNDFKIHLSSLRKLLEIRANVKKSNACLIDANQYDDDNLKLSNLFSSSSNSKQSLVSETTTSCDLLLFGATSLGVLSSSSLSPSQRTLSQMLTSEITQHLSSLSKTLDDKLRSGIAINLIGKNMMNGSSSCSQQQANNNNNNKNSNSVSSSLLFSFSQQQSTGVELRDSFRKISKLIRILSEGISLLRRCVFNLGSDDDDDDNDEENGKNDSCLVSKFSKNKNLTIFDDAETNRERNNLICRMSNSHQQESERESKKIQPGRSFKDYKVVSLIEKGISPEVAVEDFVVGDKNEQENQNRSARSFSGIFLVDWLEKFIDECLKEGKVVNMRLK